MCQDVDFHVRIAMCEQVSAQCPPTALNHPHTHEYVSPTLRWDTTTVGLDSLVHCTVTPPTVSLTIIIPASMSSQLVAIGRTVGPELVAKQLLEELLELLKDEEVKVRGRGRGRGGGKVWGDCRPFRVFR